MIILFVDDSYQNRKLLSAQLEGAERKILTASDGLEALEILQNTKVDIIISDILMPKMDGYQFCSQVRQSKVFGHLPFVFYTATYTSSSDEKLSYDLGADAFIKKPTSSKILIETIESLLARPTRVQSPQKLVMEFGALTEYSHRLVEKLEEKNYELQRRSEELELEIEEREKAEYLTKESEERFRQLTDAIHEVFWMTNVEKNEIIYISIGYEEVWGRTRESLFENPIAWLEAIHPDDRDRVFQSMKTKQTIGEYNEEYRIRRPDGEIRWIKDKAFPVKNEKGEVFRLAGVAEDITEHKLKEQQLREVEVKRNELEQQLIQAQKLESLGTLASGIAHDFNNILSIIMGHTSALGYNKNDPSKLANNVDALQKAAQRGASLVRQLLTFARKTEFNLESTRINEIILEINKLIEQTFPRNIKIVLDLSENLPFIAADANQIHQVLLNLCVNARDAMPKGGTLTIETSVVDSESIKSGYSKNRSEKYLRLAIIDTGIGMDEKTKHRIFEPFFTTKEVGKGTGLGLALAYSVVENHKGWIEVETEVGKGTRFNIYFPVPTEKYKLETKPILSVSEIPGGDEHILLIEDEELLRGMLQSLLESKGYRVATAVDGEDGVEQFLLRHSEISLILTDLGLPKLGGEEVTRRIKTINPRVKVILASGFIEPSLKQDLSDSGISLFVQKPYSAAEVLFSIRSVLDQN